jgi:hypothetical protein
MRTPVVVAAENAEQAAAIAERTFAAWAALPDERGVGGVDTEVIHATCIGQMRTLNVEQTLWQVDVMHRTKG